jgi:hypothetical protein
MPISANGGRSLDMALFMDVHDIEGGVSAADVAAAHDKDLATQKRYGVNYVHYWVSEEAGKIFCLVEAGSADDARAVHRDAHGLVADAIYEVQQG